MLNKNISMGEENPTKDFSTSNELLTSILILSFTFITSRIFYITLLSISTDFQVTETEVIDILVFSLILGILYQILHSRRRPHLTKIGK